MRMHDLCRCRAYGYVRPVQVSLFFSPDPKKVILGQGQSQQLKKQVAALNLNKEITSESTKG
ncbi:hypothetical protein ABVO81_004572 [Salmonella enterica]